jgi:NaMN:DMB phosphoribosyltransferase
LGLGYAADGRVSGSSPDNAHALKSRLARAALEVAGLGPGAKPLDVLRGVGDPMQPLAAGMTVGAARAGRDVLLAGGSQMVAVAAIVRALAGPSALERVAIGTTRWVVQDPSADVAGLARDVWSDLPLMAANLDFGQSRHAGLREYERFMVKEGVGAGGACIAAVLATGGPLSRLQAQIDATSDELLA